MIKLKNILLEIDDHGENLKHGFWGNRGAGILPVAINTKRFLISHRSQHVQEPNTFGVWGGAIDSNEEPIDAVKREFLEETGFDKKINLIPAYVFNAPNGKFTYYNFIGIIKDEFEPDMDWETQGFKWLTFDELKMLPNKHFGLFELLKNSNKLIKQILDEIDLGKYKQ